MTAFGVAVAADVALGLTLLFPALNQSTATTQAVIGALLVAVTIQVAGVVRHRGQDRAPSVELRFVRAHAVQLAAQGAILVYWALYWPQVGAHAPHFLAQLAFALAFELGLSWWLGRAWRIGLSQIPVVVSINFFLWFIDAWFALQFVMIAMAFAGKALITWERDGQRRHIFNPSALPLFLAGLVLIGTNDVTWTYVKDFPSAFELPLHMYEVIFLSVVFINIWCDTVLITTSACVAMGLIFVLPLEHLGDAFVASRPFNASVFLGMTLLVTDPASSPRSRTGKVLFGAAYGGSVFLASVLITLLGRSTALNFFDKIMPVVFLNLLVPDIERLAAPLQAQLQKLPALVLNAARQRSLQLVAWAVVFLITLPSLQHPLVPSPAPSTRDVIRVSDELWSLLRARSRTCNRQPQVCAPFAFGAELAWWRRGGLAPLRDRI